MVEGKAFCSSPEAETWLEDTGSHDFEASNGDSTTGSP